MVVIGKPLPRRRNPIWRAIFTFIVLVIILLGLVNLGLLLFRRLDQPTKPADGELLYATNFDQFNENWTLEPGQASSQIRDGALLIAIDDVSTLFSYLKRDFSDVDVQVKTTVMAATDIYDEWGVLFRFQDTNNYYMFRLRGDGAYRIQAIRNGKLDIISQWQISPVINQGIGAVNSLHIWARGAQLRFYVNGQPLPLCLRGTDGVSTWTGPNTGKCLTNGGQTSQEYVDAQPLTTGKIAVGVEASSPGVQIAFDDILVYGPTGK